MYIFRLRQLSTKELDPEKAQIDEIVKKRVNEVYGTTLVTRILAVIGLIFLLALLSVAVIRIMVASGVLNAV